MQGEQKSTILKKLLRNGLPEEAACVCLFTLNNNMNHVCVFFGTGFGSEIKALTLNLLVL